jgi:formyltetrahydrofolate-dependent phosphoribosylglycinamide formyltransferase
MTARIAVLASGGGSNLQAILDHFAALGANRAGAVVLVASNKPDAMALHRAKRAGIPTHHIDPADGDALLALFRHHGVDLVVLAGYIKLVPAAVTAHYRGRMINVHPGPLPQFGGPGMYGTRVHAAVLAANVPMTGVTVHFVDDRYDEGAVIAHWPVPVHPDDSAESLAARVLRVEHIVYPRIVDMLAATVSAGLSTI